MARARKQAGTAGQGPLSKMALPLGLLVAVIAAIPFFSPSHDAPEAIPIDAVPDHDGFALDEAALQERSETASELAPPEVSLQGSEASFVRTMRSLDGDRFSAKAQKVFNKLIASQDPDDRFVGLALMGFVAVHLNHLDAAEELFASILHERVFPSRTCARVAASWKLVTGFMRKFEARDPEQMLSVDDLDDERDAMGLLRAAVTIQEPQPSPDGKDWIWEKLFREEGMWLVQNLPDHNDKENSKCVYVPGLLAMEYHDADRFPSAVLLEQEFPSILAEVQPLLDVSENQLFQPVGGHTSANDAQLVTGGGTWTDISLYSAGVRNEAACEKMPFLCKLLDARVPEVTRNLQGHALLSRLSPGTTVKRHHGISNVQLTMHLGITVPEGAAGIEVNGVESTWHVGKMLVFDDSYPHSVWHNGTKDSGDRVVLLLRAYHPEWTLEERSKFILTHRESPWSMERRWAEVERLNSNAMRDQFYRDKMQFRGIVLEEDEDTSTG